MQGDSGHGGFRPGAGRKPRKAKTRTAKVYQTNDPLEFLRAVMRDPKVDFKERQAAAMKLAQLESKAGGRGTKKAQQKEAAEEVAGGGRFHPLAPPRRPSLKMVAGGKA